LFASETAHRYDQILSGLYQGATYSELTAELPPVRRQHVSHGDTTTLNRAR
jgi:hypothetical protein